MNPTIMEKLDILILNGSFATLKWYTKGYNFITLDLKIYSNFLIDWSKICVKCTILYFSRFNPNLSDRQCAFRRLKFSIDNAI